MNKEEGDTWRQRDAGEKQTWEQGRRLVEHRSRSWRGGQALGTFHRREPRMVTDWTEDMRGESGL